MAFLSLKRLQSVFFVYLLLFHGSLAAATPNVVVTLKPIHSLVTSVMDGIGEPSWILPDGASPHTFALKPSTLKQLHQADLIIWLGPELEQFMLKPLTQLAPSNGIITIMKIPHLTRLKQRHQRQWQDHHDHDHDHGHDHSHEYDPHLWLSIDNAIVMVKYFADYLAQIDNTNATTYRSNAKKTIVRLQSLKLKIEQQLASVHKTPFLVYHDGYQYFEKEFNLNAIGTMRLNPHLPLSAHSLKKVRDLIENQHIHCVFRETEFNDTTIVKSLHRLPVQVAELDPLGVHINAGAKLYDTLLLNMARTMHQCLTTQPKDNTDK